MRDPLEPESFERYRLWAAVAILEGVNEPAVTEPFVTAALVRFPDEPRLLLAKAFLLDRREPLASGEENRTAVLVPQMAGGTVIPARVSVSSGLPARHVREVSDAYDRVMTPDEIAVEARIRKSLLLFRAGQPREALALLESAGAPTSDLELRYLRDVLRGRALTAVGSLEEAATAYHAALGLAPQAQSPHVGLMGLALLRGDREGAAAIAEQIQKAAPGLDPWWNYWQGDYRLVPAALARLRTQTK
jgi:tetratricopeptide (TPR) repeat protein